MSKVKKYSLLVVTALILCVSFVVGGLMLSGNTEKVNAETNTFEMVEKASAPINTEGGLRFRVKMDATTKEKVVRTEEPESLSVIFLSKEVYDAGIDKGLSHAQIYDVVKDDYCVEISIDPEKVYEENGFWYGNAVLIDIKVPNMNFVAFAKLGNEFTTNYAWNNLYNVINSAFIDDKEDITGKILKNTTYDWYGTVNFPVVVNNETELNRIYNRCENNNIVIKTKGFIATEDVYALNRNVSQTFTLDETPTGTFTTNIDGFIASVSENVLTVTKTTYAGTADGLVLKVSNGNGFVKSISLVDYAIGDATEFDAWFAGDYLAENSTYNKLIVLTDDIDLAGKSTYDTESAGAERIFEGIFDGRGHKIENLSVTMGFFYRITGTFMNTAVVNTKTTKNYMPFMGYMADGATISNVYYQGTQGAAQDFNATNPNAKQVTGAWQYARNAKINNLVVIVNRKTGSTSDAMFKDGTDSDTIYVANNCSAGTILTKAHYYVTANDLALNVKEVPDGFSSDLWNIDPVDGILKLKSANITDAIEINNKQDLIDYFADAANYSKYAYLTADIDLENSTNYKHYGWKEGYSAPPLTGTFDGKGHTISNVTAWAGLFPTIGATGLIKNLAVINLTNNSGNTGVFVHSFDGTIENCYIAGKKGATASDNYDTGVFGYAAQNQDSSNAVVRNTVAVIDHAASTDCQAPALMKVDGNVLKGWSNVYVVMNNTFNAETRTYKDNVASAAIDVKGATVYKTTEDFAKAVTEIPEGFDTDLWCIDPFDGVLKYKSVKADAVIISNAAEFDAWYSAYLDAKTAYNGTVVLTNDIVLDGTKEYSSAQSTLAGTFDGRGHSIVNLKTTNGLFYNITGTFKNTAVINTVTSQYYAGFVGYNFAGATLSNIYYQGYHGDGINDFTTNAQVPGFAEWCGGAKIVNVVVVVDRVTGSTSDPISDKTVINSNSLYMVNNYSKGTTQSTNAHYYKSLDEFKERVTALPAGFSSDLWEISALDGLRMKLAPDGIAPTP